MKSKHLLFLVSAFSCVSALWAGDSWNMHVWTKDGEKSFKVEEVDSVTFSEVESYEHRLLTQWTMPPVLNDPNPLQLNDQQLEFVKGNNAFAKSCFEEIYNKSNELNLFFSPLSLNMALGLCANGASQKGAKEITDAMGFRTENALSDMNEYFNKLYLSLNSPIDSVTFKTANAIWIDNTGVVREPFYNTAKEKYYATVCNLDFLNSPAASMDTINKWAALMTNDCIKKLSIIVDNSTRMVLNNACYFLGKWEKEFDKAGSMQFNSPEGKTDVQSMEKISFYEYAKADNYQAVKVNYGDIRTNMNTGTYSMIFVLPDENATIVDVLQGITWESIPFEEMALNLRLPIFSFKNSFYDLSKTLETNGISDIFKTLPKALYETLFVDQVTQDTYIDVNEKGTEAAAVTSMTMIGSAVAPNAVILDFNKPFVFAIRENRTGLILFIGTVKKPEAKKE